MNKRERYEAQRQEEFRLEKKRGLTGYKSPSAQVLRAQVWPKLPRGYFGDLAAE